MDPASPCTIDGLLVKGYHPPVTLPFSIPLPHRPALPAVVLVPILGLCSPAPSICGVEGWVGRRFLLKLLLHSWGVLIPPAAYPSSIMAPWPLAQPGLDLIDSLWPADWMPQLSTCGRQAREEVGEKRGKGELCRPNPNPY